MPAAEQGPVAGSGLVPTNVHYDGMMIKFVPKRRGWVHTISGKQRPGEGFRRSLTLGMLVPECHVWTASGMVFHKAGKRHLKLRRCQSGVEGWLR